MNEKMRDEFATYHPWVNFLFFILVIGSSMFLLHPVFLGISCFGAICYHVQQARGNGVRLFFGFIGIVIFSALFNALFSHAGMTLLFYLKNGNPVTLESILYGVNTGAMLYAVIVWFLSFHRIITSDKLVFLFGKLVPALSLVLSMIFRLVPQMIRQAKKISEANRALYGTSRGLSGKIRQALKESSILITWELEHSIETVDSMQSRGYGLHGRTNYCIYRMEKRDFAMLFAMIFYAVLLFYGILSKNISFLFYPIIRMQGNRGYTIITAICFMVISFLPVIINRWEALKWNSLKSKI